MPDVLVIVGLLAIAILVWNFHKTKEKQEVQEMVQEMVGPSLDQLLFRPPSSECLDRAEAFMVKQGFTVTRGGSSASFIRNPQFDWGSFIILLLLGIIPGLLYAIYMNVRKSPSVTLIASSTELGTQLDVVGADPRDQALLENWLKDSNNIPQR